MAFSITRSSMMFLFPLVGILPMAAGCSSASATNGGAESATDEALDQEALSKITATPFKDRCAVSPTVVSGTGAQRLASCLAKVQTDAAGAIKSSATTPSGLTPADLKAAYAIPTSTSTATIAIVDAQDDPDAEADLGTYRKQFGLSACTTANGCFKKVNEKGQASPLPTASTDWAGEIMLDLEMASAACPTCKILLVEADAASIADLGASVNTAATLGASVISNSYGGGEDTTEHDVGRLVLPPRRSGDLRQLRRRQLRRLVSGVRSLGHRRRRHQPGDLHQHPRLGRDGLGRRGLGLLQVHHHSVLADRWPPRLRAQDGLGPLGRRRPEHPASPSTTSTARAAGPCTAAPASRLRSPRRSSPPPVTRTRTAPPSGSTPRTSTTSTTGSNGTCKTTYFCTAGKGYDGPTGWGTPIGTELAAWGAADDVKSADE